MKGNLFTDDDDDDVRDTDLAFFSSFFDGVIVTSERVSWSSPLLDSDTEITFLRFRTVDVLDSFEIPRGDDDNDDDDV